MNKRNFELEQFALEFATAAHTSIDQRRKYTDEPYIVHPVAVATIVESVGGTSIQIAAALLHDVIEDTPITVQELSDALVTRFGADIAGKVTTMVSGLTDVSTRTDGNRKVRKAIDRAHAAEQDNDTKTVKLADLLHNSKCILANDPDFAKTYIEEKQLLLDGPLIGGNQELYDQAMEVVTNYYRQVLIDTPAYVFVMETPDTLTGFYREDKMKSK
jgi:(p)ppGpp synthase/HD superfamily hydrolase